MRAKRTTRNRSADTLWQLREAATKVLMIATAVALVAGLMLIYRQQHGPTGPYRPEYEGRIVDKSVTGQETREGSHAARRLLIEGKDGVRFEVGVGPDVYERAEVGMWIKVANAQVELTRPGAQSPAAEAAK